MVAQHAKHDVAHAKHDVAHAKSHRMLNMNWCGHQT